MAKGSDFTLYSGGHKGAETAFGELAERFGLTEVTYTFEGHAPLRSRGLVALTAEERARGDISMEIVSIHMGRTYHGTDKISKVFQSIFHMVNNAQHLFVVGWIQENGIVKGGTGWGVELAKFFNRPVSVYDQDKNAWFSWKNSAWVEDMPVIEAAKFAGTGTRNLSEQGLQALTALFERSFAK